MISIGCRAPEEKISPRAAQCGSGEKPRIGAAWLTALIPCGKYGTLILVCVFHDLLGVYIEVQGEVDLEYKMI
jgi:hypothetical protein